MFRSSALLLALLLAGCTVEDEPAPPGSMEPPIAAPLPVECVAVENADEIGDVGVWPGLVPDAAHQHDAIDLVNVAIERVGAEVQLAVELAALPPTGAATDPTYRYWIGFHVLPEEGSELEYMDVRIHSYPYVQGRLIASGEQGLKDLGEYPVETDDTTWIIRFPFEIVQGLYDSGPIAIGSPEAQADGPHPQAGVQSTTYIDYNFWDEHFIGAMPCATEDGDGEKRGDPMQVP